MRSPGDAAPPDTRGRILHAAIEHFGRSGFDAPLRSIASDAGVTAPAILKHFGSKEALQRACDDHVLQVSAAYKGEAMRSQDLRGTFLEQMALLDEFQPLIRYLVRSLMTGGEVARRLLTEMYAQAEQWMRQGVETGHIKPSRNEPARVRMTFAVSLGWMLQAVITSGKDLGELDADFWKQTTTEVMLPALELYTEGLLTDRTLLEEYLLYVSDPPDAD
ncbi:TetR/AcrR family transcriptional regulator [Bogoriella caseilytica]|uniref:TetR family transcriptional regulator n=1 Tax=Bogoriella caseilytica TaxID=56055 RepID=A0A3N2BBU5_9MICO|nr:TetR/AcrR family transcriptional regulator [Bogoriella caseilytica]ROR72741.1 TetR family transcriptional regulator [Bogoriella caseilytica]